MGKITHWTASLVNLGWFFFSWNINQCIPIALLSANLSNFDYLRLIIHITHRTNDNLSCKMRVGKDVRLVCCSSETSALFKEKALTITEWEEPEYQHCLQPRYRSENCRAFALKGSINSNPKISGSVLSYQATQMKVTVKERAINGKE